MLVSGMKLRWAEGIGGVGLANIYKVHEAEVNALVLVLLFLGTKGYVEAMKGIKTGKGPFEVAVWVSTPYDLIQVVNISNLPTLVHGDHASQITFSYTHFLIKPLYSFHQSITCFRPCMAVQNSSDSFTHAHKNMQI